MSILSVATDIPGIRRAWPGPDSSIVVEWTDRVGRVRAGRIEADGTVILAPYGLDPALPCMIADDEGELVVHRFARRAVRLREDRVVKYVRPQRSRTVGRGVGAFARAKDVGVRIPGVLVEASCLVELTRIPGIRISDCDETGAAAWELLGGVWTDVFTSTPEAGLGIHRGADEADVLASWEGHARRHSTLDDLERLEPAIIRTCAALVDTDASDAVRVLAHRDLHDGQILWDGSRLGLIDLDTACAAHPALDLANLRAHVEAAHLRGRIRRREVERVIGILDGLAARMRLDVRALTAYLDAARMRIALVHSFRPPDRTWLPAWIEHCLDGSGAPWDSTTAQYERGE